MGVQSPVEPQRGKAGVMRLLDLFCGAGGAAMGYYRAGFDHIVGVDIEPQPRYPFEFVQGDALEYLRNEWLADFDLIHASPPCQAYSLASKQWRKNGKHYPDLLDETRNLLLQTGIHYVIENVPGAPLINPVVLNGAMFGMNIERVRLFECSFKVDFFLLPQNKKPVKMGRPVKEGDVLQPVGHFSNVPYAQKEMDIDWMGQKDLAQAIPPAYTEFIGRQILATHERRE